MAQRPYGDRPLAGGEYHNRAARVSAGDSVTFQATSTSIASVSGCASATAVPDRDPAQSRNARLQARWPTACAQLLASRIAWTVEQVRAGKRGRTQRITTIYAYVHLGIWREDSIDPARRDLFVCRRRRARRNFERSRGRRRRRS
jgi:hypothetical protein